MSQIVTIDEVRQAQWDAMSEEQFRLNIRDAAKQLGWPVCYHVYLSNKSDPGFPDNVIMRDTPRPRLIFAELKRENGKVTKAQRFVLDILSVIHEHVPFVEVYLWRPHDWDDILRILQP